MLVHMWCRCSLSEGSLEAYSLFLQLNKDTYLRTVSEKAQVAIKRRQQYIQLTCRIIQKETHQINPFPLIIHSKLGNISFLFPCILSPYHLIKRSSFVRAYRAQLFCKTTSYLPLYSSTSPCCFPRGIDSQNNATRREDWQLYKPILHSAEYQSQSELSVGGSLLRLPWETLGPFTPLLACL